MKLLQETLYNLYTKIFTEVLEKFGGDAATLLSKQRSEALDALIKTMIKEKEISRNGLDSVERFYNKALPILDFKFELNRVEDEYLIVKILRCPIYDKAGSSSHDPLCSLICLPGTPEIVKNLSPGYTTEIGPTLWSGEDYCRISVKKQPELMKIDEVFDALLDLKPHTCPYRGVDIPCVFCEELSCTQSAYKEFKVENGVAKKTVNSSILSINIPLKDEFDEYIVRRFTKKLGKEGYFKVMENPEVGYTLSIFFDVKASEDKEEVKEIVLKLLDSLKSILAEARVTVNNWIEKKREQFNRNLKGTERIPETITTAVKCPHCGMNLRFTIDKSTVKDAKSFPAPVLIKHGDHSITVHFDKDFKVLKVAKAP
ncbi:MAG: hypothetical protein ACTSSJ_00230 [Candidatus Odinarchaeia archaeon]